MFKKEETLQHTITIAIPETLEARIQEIEDFEAFVNAITIEALKHQDKQIQKQQLVDAAQRMLYEYENDDELTVFTALDGEPVYE